jgi:hypothetical protein
MLESRALVRLQLNEIWKRAPADGTNAALKMKRIRHVLWQLEKQATLAVHRCGRGVNDRSWPRTSEIDVRYHVGN